MNYYYKLQKVLEIKQLLIKTKKTAKIQTLKPHKSYNLIINLNNLKKQPVIVKSPSA